MVDDFAEFIKKEKENFYARSDIYNKKTGSVKSAHRTLENKIKRSEELAIVYDKYEKLLTEKRLYDFEDMILEVVKMMKEDEDFKLQAQENFLYILADEHQDANDAQNALLELLTDFHDSPNLFIVGDEKQAIYRFQGASLSNFLYFKEKFDNVTIIELKDSYRSGQEILDAGHNLMSNLDDGINRVRLSSKSNINRSVVSLRIYGNDDIEALAVAEQIRDLIDKGVSPSEIAILHRTNSDIDIFAHALAKYDIPYSIESDINALRDTDLKKFLLLLRAIANFGDDEMLARVMHADFLDLHELDIYKTIKAYRRMRSKSLHDILLDGDILKSLKLKEWKKMKVFGSRFIKFAKRARQESISELINDCMEQFGFLAYALAKPNGFDLLEKLRVLLKDAETMASGNPDYTLTDFIEHLDLLQKHGLSVSKRSNISKKNAVKLYTAHASKGLEFEYVFLVKAYDGKWGSRVKMEKFLLPVGGTNRDEDDADERRLFFVAITRAKLEVRISYGLVSDSQKERLPSKFISSLGDLCIDMSEEAEKQESKMDPRKFLVPPRKMSKSLADTDFLRLLFIEQGLSVTALNNFLSCPWNFFYSNLIRIPKMPTKYMLLGSAIHLALDILHKGANQGETYSKDELAKYMEDFLYSKALSRQVFEEAFTKAKEYLFDWIDEYGSNVGKYKTLNEYRIVADFQLESNYLPAIKLTGMLDKLEFIGPNQVRVVDYKTGKPKTKNDIMGKTRTSNGDYFRQLQFYKLLLDLEGKYELQEAVLDFVQRKDNGKMVRESFTVYELINPKDCEQTFDELKKQIIFAGESIYNFDFWDTRCKDYEKGKCEYCALRDMME